MPSFDSQGWLSSTAIEGRFTDCETPKEPLSEGFNWNFTGIRWVQLPTSGPVQEHISVIPPGSHSQASSASLASGRHARQALLLAGMLDAVDGAIKAIPDTMQRGMVQIEWDDSQVFERNRPTLLALAKAIGLDSAALDKLFLQAAKL